MIRNAIFIVPFILLTGCYSEKTKSISYWKEPVTGIEFVLVQKGSFLMGNHSTEKNASNSEIVHKVTISHDFWLGRTEVTREQWEKIMGSEEIHPEKPSPFGNSNPQYPVVSISYFDVQQFLEKLNQLSTGNYFRLPTEAEWEFACRAGTTTPFSFGTILSDTLANFNAEIPSTISTPGNNMGHPMPVASYPPNSWGLYDMHGNVWEWVSDWYAPYSAKAVVDPKGPPTGNLKVIRGGSWFFGAENAQSSSRRTHEPNLWGFSIGFRVVCEKKSSN